MFLGVFLQLFVLLYNRLFYKTGSKILFEVGNQYTLELNVTSIGVVKKAKNNSIDNKSSDCALIPAKDIPKHPLIW